MAQGQAKTTYLTQSWYDKLLEELRMLKEEKLPHTLERLKEAISQWDISENAEYDTAMSEKDLLGARIQEIELILTDVEIIEHQEWGDVRYGSVVTLEDEKWNQHTWTIVGTGEVDLLENTISFQSPLWSALRGKAAWATVQVKAPNKKYAMKIVEVK